MTILTTFISSLIFNLDIIINIRVFLQIMDSKKPPVGDFKVNIAKSKGKLIFSSTTVAMASTLMLFFVVKFIWSPFSNDRRYKAGVEFQNEMAKFEEATQR